MKFVSYNVNGIRAALNKGFANWLALENPDVIGLQEIKSTESQISMDIFRDLGYYVYWYPAIKKGYSGVAVLTKIKPNNVEFGMGKNEYDDEGRMVRLDFDNVSFASIYFPSGTTGELRQNFKYKFLDDMFGYSQDLAKNIPNLILSGDYNICHKPIDIHNPISNKNSSGFLPEERAWMEKFIQSGFVDSFRLLNPDPHNYTWWSYRAGARPRNLGWRIDYQLVTPNLMNRIKKSSILSAVNHSDHCPIALELDLS